MAKSLFADVQKLIKEAVFPFYGVKRDLHVLGPARRLENDAEHSWSLAFVACALAEHIDPALNIAKIAQMAIVHDLVELYAGDTSVWRLRKVASKEEREARAMEQIRLSFKEFPWVYRTVAEYETKSTSEAKYVWAIDKYLTLLIRYLDVSGGSGYLRRSKISAYKFEQAIEAPRRKAAAYPKIGEQYEKLIQKFLDDPELFYI